MVDLLALGDLSAESVKIEIGIWWHEKKSFPTKQRLFKDSNPLQPFQVFIFFKLQILFWLSLAKKPSDPSCACRVCFRVDRNCYYSRVKCLSFSFTTKVMSLSDVEKAFWSKTDFDFLKLSKSS